MGKLLRTSFGLCLRSIDFDTFLQQKINKKIKSMEFILDQCNRKQGGDQ